MILIFFTSGVFSRKTFMPNVIIKLITTVLHVLILLTPFMVIPARKTRLEVGPYQPYQGKVRISCRRTE